MSITPTVIPTASVAGIPLPAKDQCILYPFANYQGDPKIFTGYNTYNMSDYAADNAVSSFMCGSEVFAYFCTSPSATVATCLGGGNSTTAGRISNPSLTGSLNDSISTLIMLQYDPKSQPGVTMFDDNDCTGVILRHSRWGLMVGKHGSPRIYWNQAICQLTLSAQSKFLTALP